MAKITEHEGKFPRRIGNYVLYKMDGVVIIRAKSGFTTSGLKSDEKYAKSRNNANEFGKVSSLCKAVRMALREILPKKNNLAVVNAFTKKMREIMTHDSISVQGERNLAEALKQESARLLLKNYNFNPDAKLDLAYTIVENGITVSTKNIVFNNTCNSIGFRTVLLDFDFDTRAHQLATADWMLYNKNRMPDVISVSSANLEQKNDVIFTILELQFYTEKDGDYAVCNEEEKMVLVIDVQHYCLP